MKLREIWDSPAGWEALSKLKKNPKLAYRLLKYERKVDKELTAIQQATDDLAFEVTGEEKPPKGVPKIITITPTIEVPDEEREGKTKTVPNPVHAAYFEKLNAFLDSEADLEVTGITMDELLDALGEQKISEEDIERLEPFFQPPPPAPKLEVVDGGKKD